LVRPVLGDHRLVGESPEGSRRSHTALAPKTVRNVHNIVHRALKDAVRWGYLLRNVAEAADPDAAVRASRMGKSAAWLLRWGVGGPTATPRLPALTTSLVP
jgi:hypothetical protein